MKLFFLSLEIFIYIWMSISILRKKDLSIVYLPFFVLSYALIDSSFPKGIFLLFFSCMVAYYVIYNLPFLIKYPFSILLVTYYSILVMNVSDFESVRKDFIVVISLFLLICAVPEIYKKYPRDVVLNELTLSALIILIVFITNSLFSTFFNFRPKTMYGISSGISNGNLVFAAFNFLPLACYLVFKKALEEKNKIYFFISIISIFLTLLTLRRSVILMTLIGVLLLVVSIVEIQNLKKVFGIVMSLSLILLVVISSTDFLDAFNERYEKRRLDEKELGEEQRFEEIGLVFKDLFLYYDYSPWFGYGLFDASGNYGKGYHGTRNLHTDFAVLIHSSGFLGLFLYLGLVLTVFFVVWKNTKTKFDYIQFVFISMVFAMFFITGRYNQISSTLMIYLILCLPLSADVHKRKKNKEVHEIYKINP